MPWCAEIRPVLSRLRWCDASSDVDEALSDLEKIFVLSEAWNAAVDISSAYPDCWRVDENSFYHTFLLGRAKTYGCFHLWEWLSMFTKCTDISIELQYIKSLCEKTDWSLFSVKKRCELDSCVRNCRCGEEHDLHVILDECALRICISPKMSTAAFLDLFNIEFPNALSDFQTTFLKASFQGLNRVCASARRTTPVPKVNQSSTITRPQTVQKSFLSRSVPRPRH
uniref:Bm9747 n=1 Tax=Brugia malayi TaxID=6279 RepID=A0A1I9G1Y3_BRUMA|nr:Bm9747 [Brugia malayi]